MKYELLRLGLLVQNRNGRGWALIYTLQTEQNGLSVGLTLD